MEIQRFRGDPTKWQTFFDSFGTSIHTASLSDVQKFIFLIGYLEGGVLNVILGHPKTTRKRYSY